jgi:hypothetical protein
LEGVSPAGLRPQSPIKKGKPAEESAGSEAEAAA